MTERPIIFNGPMVCAILDGRKTQTRRVMRPQPGPDIDSNVLRRCEPKMRGAYRYIGTDDGHEISIPCPYGRPGDRLWVKEKFQPLWEFADDEIGETRDWKTGKGYKINYPATDGVIEWWDQDKGPRTTCKPSIHMPRWASRITLEVVSIRVERVQEISDVDAIAEGIEPLRQCVGFEVEEFSRLWDSINAKRGFGWEKNPWIWALTFRLLEAKK